MFSSSAPRISTSRADPLIQRPDVELLEPEEEIKLSLVQTIGTDVKIKPSDKDMIPDDEQMIMADEDMIAADQQTNIPDDENHRLDLRTMSREKQSLEDDMRLLPRVGLTITPDVHLEPRVVPILGLDRSTIGLDILVFTAVEPLLAAEVLLRPRGLDLLLLYNPHVDAAVRLS
jgi:hypothetical protein